MPFEIKSQNDYLLLRVFEDCSGDENPSVDTEASKVLQESGLKNLIVQCSDCGNMTPSFLRQLSLVYRDLKKVNGKIRLVAAKESIQKLIVAQGLDRILVNKLSLRGALVDIGLAKEKAIDVNFVNPFLAATIKVLKVQCFLEAKPMGPALKKPSDPPLLGDVSGIIAINAEGFQGSLAISFSNGVFLHIVEKMFGEKVTEITTQNVDLVGELSNMILGQAKIELSSLGFSIQQAIPSVIWGKDHKIKQYGGGICVVIPFETPAGPFHIEIFADQGLLNLTSSKIKSEAS